LGKYSSRYLFWNISEEKLGKKEKNRNKLRKIGFNIYLDKYDE